MSTVTVPAARARPSQGSSRMATSTPPDRRRLVRREQQGPQRPPPPPGGPRGAGPGGGGGRWCPGPARPPAGPAGRRPGSPAVAPRVTPPGAKPGARVWATSTRTGVSRIQPPRMAWSRVVTAIGASPLRSRSMAAVGCLLLRMTTVSPSASKTPRAAAAWTGRYAESSGGPPTATTSGVSGVPGTGAGAAAGAEAGAAARAGWPSLPRAWSARLTPTARTARIGSGR